MRRGTKALLGKAEMDSHLPALGWMGIEGERLELSLEC